MRFAVTGGRNFRDYSTVERALASAPEDAVLVHGGARGVDRLCAAWWSTRDRTTEPHPANWAAPCRDTCEPGHRRSWGDGDDDYCPAAGVYRNQEMVDSGLDVLIAFPGGRGTQDMIRRCREAGVRVHHVAQLPTQ